MGTYTKNLKLETPSYTDNADIPALAKKNNEIIDSEMIKRANGLDYNEQTGVLQLTGNNSKVGSPIQIKNNLPVTSMASGTELKVNNYKQLIKFTKEGKTEQKSYTGKNLLNYIDNLQSTNGLTNTINSDGSITTTGTPTKDFAYITKDYVITDMLEDGQTYTISQAIASNKLYLQINARKKSDKTYIHIAINSDNVKSKSFKVDKSTYDLYSVNIQTTAMSLWGSSSLTITNKYMLCKGTDTADSSFEPYVGKQPSPNPNYPQEIVNVRGVENLLNIPDGTYTDNGVTAVVKGGIVTLNGTSTANSFISIPFNYTFLANINYTLSANNTLTMSGENYIRFNYGTTVCFPCRFSYEKSKFTNNFNENTIVNVFTIRTESGKTYNNFVIKPMLEEGSTSHNFVLPGTNYLQLEDRTENLIGLDNKQYRVNLKKGDKIFAVNNGTTNLNLNLYTNYGDTARNDFFTIAANSQRLIVIANDSHAIAWGGTLDNNAWVVKGEKFIPYEQYQEKIINVDLKGNNLCSDKEQTLKDELVIENGRAKIIKKYDEYVFTGNEAFGFADNNTKINTDSIRLSILSKVYIETPNKNTNVTPLFCTHYKPSTQSNTKPGSNTVAFASWNGTIYFYFPADYSTIDEFKAKLKSLYDAGTPVIIQYPLAEPEIIDLGKVDFDLIENSTLTCEEESNMQIDYLTISSNIFVQDSLDGNSSQKAPSVDAIKKYFGKKVYDKDENGWIKIEFFDHTEYVTEGQITQIDFSTGWGVSKLLSLPVGMSTIGDRILSGNVRTFDAAISVNISGILTETQITYNWKNNHSSNVTTGLNYSLRILEYV